MPDHEPLDIADKDDERRRKPEARAAREEGTTPAGLDTAKRGSADVRSDAAEAASEPMVLERLPESGPVPPGKERTGDPPATGRKSER